MPSRDELSNTRQREREPRQEPTFNYDPPEGNGDEESAARPPPTRTYGKDADANVDFSIAEILSQSVKRTLREQGYEAGGRRGGRVSFIDENYNTTPVIKPIGMTPKNGWEATGLRSVVVQTMLRAFPEASRITALQRSLLTQLIKGCSVMAYGPPASGKSFAIIAWLLTLPRAMALPEGMGEKVRAKPRQKPRLTTTALIVAPNVDLVRQYHANIAALLEATGSPAIMDNPDGFVQALYRGEDEAKQIELLRTHRTPHILIATPTVLLDILSSKDLEIRGLVDYTALRAVVVEESDQAFVRYENPIYGRVGVDSEKPKDPLLILLDYVFQARKAAIIKAGGKLSQPQLVIPSSGTGAGRLARVVETYHPSWMDGENRPGFTPFTGKGKSSPAAVIARVGQNGLPGVFHRQVPDNITHHIVAYDPITGFLRDAPVPVYSDPQAISADIKALEEYEKEVETALAATFEENTPNGQLNPLINSQANMAPELIRRGYPPEIAAELLEMLLTIDGWPKNVIAVIGDNASWKALAAACAGRGIVARNLTFESWNATAASDGRAPLGRLDLLLSNRNRSQTHSGNKESTTVWITNYHSMRGLDVPDVNHAYVLHRVSRVRQYITYAGRVGRWPFTTSMEASRDPRALGKDLRPKAKVVSVLLEEHSVGGGDSELGYSAVINDGSDMEEWTWRKEALRLAKIGLGVEKYIPGGVVQTAPTQMEGGGEREEDMEDAIDRMLEEEMRRNERVVKEEEGEEEEMEEVETEVDIASEIRAAETATAEEVSPELVPVKVHEESSESVPAKADKPVLAKVEKVSPEPVQVKLEEVSPESAPAKADEPVQAKVEEESLEPVPAKVEEVSPEPAQVKVEEVSPEPAPAKADEPVQAKVEEEGLEPVPAKVEEVSPEPAQVKVEKVSPEPVQVKREEPVQARVEEVSPEPAQVKVDEPVQARVEEESPEPVPAKVEEVSPESAPAKVDELVQAKVEEEGLEPVPAKVEEVSPEPAQVKVEEVSPEPAQVKVEKVSPEPVQVKREEPVQARVEGESPGSVPAKVEEVSPEPAQVKVDEPVQARVEEESVEPAQVKVEEVSPELAQVKVEEPVQVRVEASPEPAPAKAEEESLESVPAKAEKVLLEPMVGHTIEKPTTIEPVEKSDEKALKDSEAEVKAKGGGAPAAIEIKETPNVLAAGLAAGLAAEGKAKAAVKAKVKPKRTSKSKRSPARPDK